LAVRRLSLVLDLDSGQFSTRITDATGKIKSLSSQAAVASTKVESMGKSTQAATTGVDALNKAVWKLQLTLYSVTFLFGGFTAGLVKVNAEAQRSMALLEGLSKKTDQLGRKADAASDFKYLRDFAKNAPYDLNALTDVFVKLKSAGIDPAAGGMRALVDGVASFGGSADTLHRATIAIQQMAGKGTVSMEELRQQLGEAMPTALRIMAKAAGMEIPKFVNEVSKGRVAFTKNLQEKFFAELEAESKGASDRLMNTLGGQTSRIKSNMQQLALAVGGFKDDGSFSKGGFMDTLTQGAKDLNTWLANPGTIDGAKELGKSLADLLIVTKSFFEFIGAHANELKLLGEAFIVIQGANLAKKALEGLAMSMLAVRTAQQSGIKEAISAKAAQLSAAMGTYKAQEAAALKAKEVVAANRTEIASIEQNIAALRQEAAAYTQNIALANEQKVAAAAAAYQQQRNATSGMSRLFVGAGGMSAPIKGAAADALLAERAASANRTALTKVTEELALAETTLAGRTAALAVSQEAASVAIANTSVMSRVAAAATSALSATMGTLSAMLGGPLGIAMIAIGLTIGAVASGMSSAKRSTEELRNEISSANDVIASTNSLLTPAVTGVKDIGKEAVTAAGGMTTFAGETGKAADQLYRLADAKRQAALADIDKKREEVSMAVSAAQNKTGKGAWRLMNDPARSLKDVVDATVNGVGVLGQNIYTGGQFGKDQEAAIKDGERKLKDLDDAARRLRAPTSTEVIGKNMKANGEFVTPTDDPKKTGKNKVTTAQRMEGQIDKLGANAPAIDALIDTMDQGSKAAEDMRAKIAAMREEGKKISPEQEARAISAAKESEKLGKAYEGIRSILDGLTTQQAAAADAGANLGDSYNKTEASADRFNRKLDAQLAKIIELDPALAKDEARMKKLNDVVDQSKAAFRFTQIADAARSLAEEMSRIDDHALNPDFASWDEWKDKITDITQQIEAANKLEPGGDRDKLLKSLEESRAKFSDRYVRQIESDAEREMQATKDGLMTADQARQSAYERELERIKNLTDVSNMSEEEKAKYASRMATLREQLSATAAAQYQRDTESSAERLAREWSDLTGNLKGLTGDWMQDFHDQVISGEFSFKKFMGSILVDYLDTLLKARLASMLQPAADGLIGALGKGLGSIAGSLFGTTAAGTASGGSSAGMSIKTSVAHTGGVIGRDSLASRTVSAAHFLGAPRVHSGGLPGMKSGEVAAILQKGEGVFTKEQMKSIGGKGTPNVQVNVINESGTPLDAQQQGGRFDGDSYIIDVLVDAISRPGKARNAVLGAR
jgi:tape measure domain-containing protein